MRPLDQRLTEFAATCRKAGLKATHQRTEIFRELAQTVKHPDAETLYRRVKRRIPAISFDTVYRTLRTLEEHGVIARVDSPLARSRFDANLERHHHFVCASCGLIQDLQCAEFSALKAPATIREFGVAEAVHVEVRGRCAACLAKGSNGRR